MGKPSESAILAASVGLFSYHVNRRRRPGRGEVAAALSENGDEPTRSIEIGKKSQELLPKLYNQLLLSRT